MRVVDLTGKRFGKLIVLSKAGHNETGKKITWNCICDCGNKCVKQGIYMTKGKTTSCGCMSSRNHASENNSTHKMSGTKFYIIWGQMKSRCLNKKNRMYYAYGGRGITFCEKWDKFEGFYEDMYDSYEYGLSIERIDVNKGYYKENCTWIPIKDQQKNKTTTRIFDKYPGKHLKELCEEYGVTYGLVTQRINKLNMEIEEALTKPIQIQKRCKK